MPKFYILKASEGNVSRNNVRAVFPSGIMDTSDYGKLVTISSGGIELMAAASSDVGVAESVAMYGILRGLPNGKTTAGSSQYVIFTPVQVGDVLDCKQSSDAVGSSDIGKQLPLGTANAVGISMSTVGTVLTMGGLFGVLTGVESSNRCTVQVVGVRTIKLTTA